MKWSNGMETGIPELGPPRRTAEQPEPKRNQQEELRAFAMSATLIKNIINGVNIMTDLRIILARNKEEAMGKYILEINEQCPDHYIHVRPLAMEITRHDAGKE
jgi:type VI protein secretion system component VasF